MFSRNQNVHVLYVYTSKKKYVYVKAAQAKKYTLSNATTKKS